jgi:hypothetical protein
VKGYLRGKDPRLPIGQEAEWTSELVCTQRLGEKYFPVPGIDPRSTRLVRHYTDAKTHLLLRYIITNEMSLLNKVRNKPKCH